MLCCQKDACPLCTQHWSCCTQVLLPATPAGATNDAGESRRSDDVRLFVGDRHSLTSAALLLHQLRPGHCGSCCGRARRRRYGVAAGGHSRCEPRRKDIAVARTAPLKRLAVAALPDQKLKIEKYTEALTAALSADSADSCKSFVEHSAHPARPRVARTRSHTPRRVVAVLSDRNPLVISRQLLGLFAAEIGRLSPDVLKVRARRRASAAACARPASQPRTACPAVAALRARAPGVHGPRQPNTPPAARLCRTSPPLRWKRFSLESCPSRSRCARVRHRAASRAPVSSRPASSDNPHVVRRFARRCPSSASRWRPCMRRRNRGRRRRRCWPASTSTLASASSTRFTSCRNASRSPSSSWCVHGAGRRNAGRKL